MQLFRPPNKIFICILIYAISLLKSLTYSCKVWHANVANQRNVYKSVVSHDRHCVFVVLGDMTYSHAENLTTRFDLLKANRAKTVSLTVALLKFWHNANSYKKKNSILQQRKHRCQLTNDVLYKTIKFCVLMRILKSTYVSQACSPIVHRRLKWMRKLTAMSWIV